MIWWKFRVLSEKETREGLFRIFSTKQYFRMPLEGQARCLLPFSNSWLCKKLKEPTWYANTTCLWLEWTSWINSSHIIIWHTRQGSSGKKVCWFTCAQSIVCASTFISAQILLHWGIHKKCLEFLVRELVRPYLDLIRATKPTRNSAAIAKSKSFCRKATVDARLVRKHYMSRHPVRRKCSLCTYEVNPETGKRKDTKTIGYCEKCETHVCHNCFRDFHSKNNLRK